MHLFYSLIEEGCLLSEFICGANVQKSELRQLKTVISASFRRVRCFASARLSPMVGLRFYVLGK